MEDLDRLSTTSAMSESSVSHRLNDVQDVQDIARMQEESKSISCHWGSHQCALILNIRAPNLITSSHQQMGPGTICTAKHD